MKILYVILSVLFMISCYLWLTIFTSLMPINLPFLSINESSWMQFIGILFIAWAMLVISLLYFILWKYIEISQSTKLLPIITAVILSIDLFIGGGLGKEMQYIWAIISFIAIILSIIFTTKDLVKK